MSKVNGVISLIQNKEQIYKQLPIKAIKSSNKIVYKENNIHVTILNHNNTINMKRKHPEYLIEMTFEIGKVCKGKYFVEELGSFIELETNTSLLVYDNSKIEIEYELTMDKELVGHFYFLLELEV